MPDEAADPPAAFVREVDGIRLRFDRATIRGWDASLRRMTGDGINIVAVILNTLADRGAALGLIHPATKQAEAPFGLGAFNLTTRRGVASFVGAPGFLAERDSRPDQEFGTLGGFIIGNELDSHWTWHNLGETDLETVAQQHALELRLAWFAVREHSSGPGVFTSLTHSWARPNSAQPTRNTSGRALLDRLTEIGRAHGDFGWDVAYHPYPQNLFEPRFWNDRLAMFGCDSPMITFRNAEPLPAYFRRSEMLGPGGEPRRVIFSEQGLHTPEGPDGETIQAAAFALAEHRIERIDGVDAFILHRHVDARGEGGLWLGLRHPGGPDTEHPRMGAKKKSWDGHQAAETADFRSVASYATGVAGCKSWDEADPREGPFPDHAPEWAGFEKRDGSIFDLVEKMGDARLADTLDAGVRLIGPPDGGMAESVYLHPLGPDQPAATAAWELDLPAEPAAEFVFQTHLQKKESSGVVFRVLVDGEERFSKEVADQAMIEHRIDLSASAGKTIRLTLEVAPGVNNDHDQAHFLAPAIVSAGNG